MVGYGVLTVSNSGSKLLIFVLRVAHSDSIMAWPNLCVASRSGLSRVPVPVFS
jgi:hypothetical protein